MSTADRLIELAVRNKLELTGIPAFREAAQAIVNELIAEPSPEPTPDDILFKETDAARKPPTSSRAKKTRTTSTKRAAKRSSTISSCRSTRSSEHVDFPENPPRDAGNASERLLLVRDKNRLVASAAIRSPKIQDNEIVMISNSRNVSDDVLRIIASNREWTQSHQVKLNW